MAILAVLPLLWKAARAGLYPYYCDEYFILSMILLYGKYDLSYGKFNRKGKPQTPQAGPHDDFYFNRRSYTPVCLIVWKGKQDCCCVLLCGLRQLSELL